MTRGGAEKTPDEIARDFMLFMKVLLAAGSNEQEVEEEDDNEEEVEEDEEDETEEKSETSERAAFFESFREVYVQNNPEEFLLMDLTEWMKQRQEFKNLLSKHNNRKDRLIIFASSENEILQDYARKYEDDIRKAIGKPKEPAEDSAKKLNEAFKVLEKYANKP